MRDISVLGIDIAKHVFYLHGVDKRGECILRKKVSRSKLLGETEELPRSCKIAMESCGSSHHLSSELKDCLRELRDELIELSQRIERFDAKIRNIAQANFFKTRLILWHSKCLNGYWEKRFRFLHCGYRIKGSDKQAEYICAAYSYFSDVTFS